MGLHLLILDLSTLSIAKQFKTTTTQAVPLRGQIIDSDDEIPPPKLQKEMLINYRWEYSVTVKHS